MQRTILAAIGSVLVVMVALALDLFTTVLLIAGFGALFPGQIWWPLATLMALFAMAYPMAVLFLMIGFVQKAWAQSTAHKAG